MTVKTRYGLLALLVALLYAAPVTYAQANSVPSHRIWLGIDTQANRVSVSNSIKVFGGRSLKLSTAPWLNLESVQVDGKSIDVEKTDAGPVLRLQASRVYEVVVRASGKISNQAPGGGQAQSAGAAYFGKDGFYLPSWTNWVPGFTSVPADYELTVEAPVLFPAVATGWLQSETSTSQGNKSVFVAKGATEAPSVFAGPYTIQDLRSGPVRIRTYFHKPVANLAGDYLKTSEGFIKRYAEEIGPYPYKDFYIVSGPLPVGLGFPNLTYINARILRLPFMRGRSLAHEVLHNWWGNGVVADYATGNWAEGLTTYMADHALAEDKGPGHGTEMRLGWLRDYAALPAKRDVPVSAFTSKRHDASQVIGYGKVAFIFHMLKHEIGAEKFRAGLRQFWSAYQHKTAGWGDIRSVFETVSGADLKWFFEQWTARTGAPTVRLRRADVSANGDGYQLRVTIAQPAPHYRLKVPIAVQVGDNVHRAHVLLKEAIQTVYLKFEARPTSVHIDPDHTLFRRLLPGEAPPILRDILFDRSTKLIVLNDEDDFRKAAQGLSVRLFRQEIEGETAPVTRLTASPYVVIGTRDETSRFLSAHGLSFNETALPAGGSARAFTVARKSGRPLLVVEAKDSKSIQAITRPLPHYRSRSFIVFDGRRAVSRGIWPVSDSPLRKSLQRKSFN